MDEDWNRRHNGILHISDYKHQPDTSSPYPRPVDAFLLNIIKNFIIWNMMKIVENLHT